MCLGLLLVQLTGCALVERPELTEFGDTHPSPDDRVILVQAQDILDARSDTHTVQISLLVRKQFGISSAVPLPQKGYYLTANHATLSADGQPEDLWLISFNPEGIGRGRARVVARMPRADLALLQSRVVAEQHLEWSPVGEDVRPGESIYHLGFRTGNRTNIGRMKSRLRADRPGDPFDAFTFSAKTKTGDSGGPVLDDQGRLLGVITEWRLNYLYVRDSLTGGKAVRPNVPELNRLIAQDQAEQAAL